MENKELKELAILILENKIPKNYLVTSSHHGSTYKIGNRYIKHLCLKKHKLAVIKDYLTGVNHQVGNLKSLLKVLAKNNIKTYSVKELLSLKHKNFVHRFYEAEEVLGENYSKVYNKELSTYVRALEKALLLIKLGYFNYDFHSGNYFIQENKGLIFIDLDEVKTSLFKNKEKIKTLTAHYKNLKIECEKYSLDWIEYEKEFFKSIIKILNIPEDKIKQEINSCLKKRAFNKKIREFTRKFR